MEEHPPTPPGIYSDDSYIDSPPLPNRGTPKVSKAQAMMSQRLFGLSATKQRKRAQVSKQIPKECTFKPKVNKSRHKRKTGAPIGERLYKERDNTQRRKEALKKRIQTETFKPKLVTNGYKSKKTAASQKRINKLFNDSKSRDTKLRAAQKKKQQQDKAHGYKPQISKKARNIKSGRVKFDAGSSMMQRAKLLEKRKKERELKNCTFKPKLTRSRSAPKARVAGTFLERMNAFEAKKGQNISKLLQKQYNQDKKNLTFAPKREGARRRKRNKASGNIGNRLYHMGREREKALQKKIARKKMNEVKKHKFKPKIGRSRSAGRARPRGKSIYDRLYGESRLLKENREKAIKQKEKSSMEGLFKPQIKSQVEAPARSRNSIWERLAVHDVKNRQQTQQEFQAQRERREMEECSFAPVVDVEREEEEYDDIFDRLYETDIGATDYQATGAEECTFEPELPVTSQEIAGYSVNGDVYDRLSSLEGKRQLERELNAKKKEMEIEGCTFTPNLSNNEKVYGGTQSRTSKDDTFSRLSTPKHKIPKSGTESTSKRPVRRKSPATKQRGAKAAGKVSFIDRVKQKAKKAAGKPESASNKLTNPEAAAPSLPTAATPPSKSIMGISLSTTPATPATPATSSDDEESQPKDDGPLEF